MTNDDDTAPATKADITALMEQLGSYYVKTQEDLAELKTQFTGFYDKTNDRLEKVERKLARLLDDVTEWRQEMARQLPTFADAIRADLLAVKREEIELLKDAKVDHGERIRNLERSVGIAAG